MPAHKKKDLTLVVLEVLRKLESKPNQICGPEMIISPMNPGLYRSLGHSKEFIESIKKRILARAKNRERLHLSETAKIALINRIKGKMNSEKNG